MRARTSWERVLDFGHAGFVERRFFGGGEFRGGHVQVPAAGLVQIAQIPLLADQLQFDRAAALLSGLRVGPQSLQRFIERGQRSAARRLRCRQVFDPGHGRSGLVGQLSGPLIQLDVVGQQARAFHAHALQFALQFFAPRDHLLDVRFDSSRGRLLAAQTLVEPGQFGPHMRVLFADRVCVGLQTFVFAARELQSFFLIEALLLALRDGRLALLALLAGAFVFSRKPLQLQASHRKTRAGSRIFFGQLALLVIERQRVLFLRLLLRAHVLQLLGQLRRALFELLQRSGQRVGFAFAGFHLRAELAKLALQRQRTAARLAAAADRVAVIADAIRKQEIVIGMRGSQTLGCGVILDQEAVSEPGQIVRLVQAQRIAQASGDFWI